MAKYSIWIVEYARVQEYAVGGVFYGRNNAGHMVLPYCYGVVEGEDHLAVVDTGFNLSGFAKTSAEMYGVGDWQPPEVVLGRLGIDPADVDTVVLTHNHFDHAGGVEYFPNARVFIQRRELSQYLWAAELPGRLQWLTLACDPDLPIWLVERLKRGLLTLVDGDLEIMPGVRLVAAHDTHTPGSQYVTIENDHDGRWLMAGDAVYTYENFTGTDGDGQFVPIGLVSGSLQRCLLAMEDMYQYVGGEVARVLPFHELHIWEHFPNRTFDDGLHAAEVSLRPGHATRIGVD